MLSSRECWLLALLVVGVASVTQDSMNPNVWKEAALKGIEAECQEGDVVACVRAKFMRTMDNFLTKDSFKLSDTVSVVARKSSADEEGANNLFGDEDQSVADSWVSRALHFLRTHDVQLQTAAGRATVSSRALDAGRLDVSLQFEDVQGEGEDRDEGALTLRSTHSSHPLPTTALFSTPSRDRSSPSSNRRRLTRRHAASTGLSLVPLPRDSAVSGGSASSYSRVAYEPYHLRAVSHFLDSQNSSSSVPVFGLRVVGIISDPPTKQPRSPSVVYIRNVETNRRDVRVSPQGPEVPFARAPAPLPPHVWRKPSRIPPLSSKSPPDTNRSSIHSIPSVAQIANSDTTNVNFSLDDYDPPILDEHSARIAPIYTAPRPTVSSEFQQVVQVYPPTDFEISSVPLVYISDDTIPPLTNDVRDVGMYHLRQAPYARYEPPNEQPSPLRSSGRSPLVDLLHLEDHRPVRRSSDQSSSSGIVFAAGDILPVAPLGGPRST